MSNRNYVAGRRLEYAVVKNMDEAGFAAFRTAGSHSFYDVIAIRRSAPHTVVMIQCKRTGKEADAKRMGNKFCVAPPFDPMLCEFEQIMVTQVKGQRTQWWWAGQ